MLEKKSSKNTEPDRHNHAEKKRTFRTFRRILEKKSSRSGLNSGTFSIVNNFGWGRGQPVRCGIHLRGIPSKVMNTSNNPSKDGNTSLGWRPAGPENIASKNSRPLEGGDIIGMGRGGINANMAREAHFGAEWVRDMKVNT